MRLRRRRSTAQEPSNKCTAQKNEHSKSGTRRFFLILIVVFTSQVGCLCMFQFRVFIILCGLFLLFFVLRGWVALRQARPGGRWGR